MTSRTPSTRTITTDHTFTLTATQQREGGTRPFGAGVVPVNEGQSGQREKIWPDGTYHISWL